MREMVLNHASVSATNLHAATELLEVVTKGVARLIDTNIADASLRLHQPIENISCVGQWTLDKVLQAIRGQGARDEYVLFMRLTQKYPLLSDVYPAVKDRFNLCEATGCGPLKLPVEDGKPLMLCAINDGIAVGFPSEPIWDRHEIEVTFQELLPNDEFESQTETVDNLTRPEHASAIIERHRDSIRDIPNTAELWGRRTFAFPNLVFGPDVEDHLKDVNNVDVAAIVKKLSMIDRDAADWQATDSSMPKWRGNITPESNRVRNNQALIGARRFRSSSGSIKVFEWHARFGNAGRIHLRFETNTKEVEIGYIGEHLPL